MHPKRSRFIWCIFFSLLYACSSPPSEKDNVFMQAEKGNAEAQYNLGYMYVHGQGVTKNHTEAAKWIRKAAEQVYAFAQYQLGLMHSKGQGVPQDYEGIVFPLDRSSIRQYIVLSIKSGP